MQTVQEPLIDIGVNLTNKRFAADLNEVLERARAAGLVHAVVTGTSAEESREAMALAERFPDFLSATAGVHPHVAKTWNREVESTLAQLLQKKGVVAAGECGLDFNRDFSPRDQQQTCFAAQLAMATSAQKPVFLHQRDAHGRFLDILREYRDQLPGAVVHCFTGDKREAFDYLDLDCHLGITGWLCDERRGEALREAAPHIPLDRLMIETDAPYLTPRSLRPRPRSNRNEPAFLPEVLCVLADLRGLPASEVALATTAAARRFFGIAGP